MHFIRTIRNGIYLFIGIFLAFLGIKFGLYDLIINIFNNNSKQISVYELYKNGAGLNRNVEIKDGMLWDIDLKYLDGKGNIRSYIYLLTLPDTSTSKTVVVVVNSPSKIDINNSFKIKGLLKPFSNNLDSEIENLLRYHGYSIAENNYWLDFDKKPWKWYWNLLILFISGLFIYRLIEAIIKGIKKAKTPKIEPLADKTV